MSPIEREATATADLVKSAREVHAVVMDAFAHGPVLPFRYPTLVEDEAELEKLAQERGEAFAHFLNWVGPRVQMDVRLSMVEGETKGPSIIAAKTGPPPLGTTNTSATPPKQNQLGWAIPDQSGTQYLMEKARRKSALQGAAEKCRQTAVSADWRVEEREKILICHVLLERVEVVSFQERMSRLELPDGVKGVVSGPWPPAAFWEDKSR